MQTRKSKVLTSDKSSVTVGVSLYGDAATAKEIYITGCTPELGAWNPENAVRLRRKGSRYETSIEVGSELVEFKVLSKRDWTGVEKGMHGEELANHQVTPGEFSELEVGVQKWYS